MIQKNVNLATYTSWLVGGNAECFAMPENVQELVALQKHAFQKKWSVTVLGGGSNVLISDNGISGLTICLRKLTGTVTQEEDGVLKITALAGTPKAEILKIFLKYKLSPALFLAGIPGNVGGGVVMNAGVAENFEPREFNQIVKFVEVLKPDGDLVTYPTESLVWTYRHSHGWQEGIITRVGLHWPMKEDPTILEKVKEANKTRLSKQPLDKPSCGSVFVNPPGMKAAQLIDSCGLKGFTIGGAQVSEKHANFIVNIRSAKAIHIFQVIEHVKATVLKEKGVSLSTEVICLGEW